VLRSWWFALAFGTLALSMSSAAQANETAGLVSILEPKPYDVLETFWVNNDGSIGTVLKQYNKVWDQPYEITAQGLAVPNTSVTAVWSTENDQLEVFWVDRNGVVNDVWKDHESAWHQPIHVSSPGFAPPGAPLTGVWDPHTHELLVFGIGQDGSLRMASKANNTKWNPSTSLQPAGYAVANEKPGVAYQPINEHVEVFTVGPEGRIWSVWKAHDQGWQPKFYLTNSDEAIPGTSVTAIFEPKNNELEVFFADRDGAILSVSKVNDGKWGPPMAAGQGQTVRPGAPLGAVYRDSDDHVEVFGVAPNGTLVDAWRAGKGLWQQPALLIPSPGRIPSGNSISAVIEPSGDQMEVMYHDAVGTVWDSYKQGDGAWKAPLRLTSIQNSSFVTPGQCTNFYRQWSIGRDPSDGYMMGNCNQIMGITAYCAKQDAFVAVDPRSTIPQRLQCASYSHPDTIAEQAAHIATGVEQGLKTALLAASPYLGPVVEGAACVEGAIYACGALAIEIVDAAVGKKVNPVDQAAMQLGYQALACADGNVVTCATLAQRGIKAATGYSIPAGNLVGLATDATDCANQNFAACARIGESAAEAAGVPKTVLPELTSLLASAPACLNALNNDPSKETNLASDPCLQLGLQAAAVAVPKGGLANGAALGAQCLASNQAACIGLGREAALAAGVPAGLAYSIIASGPQCGQGDTNACVNIGIEAAQVSGVPLGNIVPLQQCANGNNAACVNLANAVSGLAISDTGTTATLISKCVNEDLGSCQQLGKLAMSKYAPGKVQNVASLVPIPDTTQMKTMNGSSEPPAKFEGTWELTSDKNWRYRMVLNQNGPNASGTLLDQANRKGSVSGTIVGKVFSFTWVEDGGYNGTGSFTLTRSTRIEGAYTSKTDGSSGSWFGERKNMAHSSTPSSNNGAAK
jgi:hypothetical protein